MEREVDGTSCSQAYAPFMMCLCTFAALDLRPERANQRAVKTAPWHMNLFRRHIEILWHFHLPCIPNHSLLLNFAQDSLLESGYQILSMLRL